MCEYLVQVSKECVVKTGIVPYYQGEVDKGKLTAVSNKFEKLAFLV